MTDPASWSDERVWRAFDQWRWIPPGARHVRTEEYELAVTPGAPEVSYTYGFRARPAEAEATLDRLHAQVIELGGAGAKVLVTPFTQPADLAERLVRRGFEPKDETDVLVWELRDASGAVRLPDFRSPEGVEVREVRTDEGYEHFRSIAGPVFGDPPPPAAVVEAFRKDLQQKLRDTGHTGRYVAYLHGTPVGCGGVEVAGEVARFWGTGVLAEHRGRGIYGALVRARCRDSQEQGAELVLVMARIGTSGPILKHHGFRQVGSVRIYQGYWRGA